MICFFFRKICRIANWPRLCVARLCWPKRAKCNHLHGDLAHCCASVVSCTERSAIYLIGRTHLELATNASAMILACVSNGTTESLQTYVKRSRSRASRNPAIIGQDCVCVQPFQRLGSARLMRPSLYARTGHHSQDATILTAQALLMAAAARAPWFSVRIDQQLSYFAALNLSRKTETRCQSPVGLLRS